MNPLAALSSLTANTGAVNLPMTPTTPGMPGAPVTEGFSNLMSPLTTTPAMPSVASVNSLPDTASALGSGDGPTTWGHMVQQMVMGVNDQQASAAAKVNDVLKGGPTPVHDAMIATEQASLSFEFLAEVRNKLTDAYQQVMQMQV